MDDFIVRPADDIYKKEKKKKTLVLGISIAVAVVICMVLVVIGSYFVVNRSFSGYDVVSQRERKDSNNVNYMSVNDNLLKYSRDGISLLNGQGETLWNGGYEMEKPIVDVCGEYVAVADAGAKVFYVYDGKGQGKSMEMTFPVGRVKVSENGKVAVLLHDGESDLINVYDPFNAVEPLEVEIPTNVEDNGYPLDFDISPQGDSVVVSYLMVKNGAMENQLCFYNFTEVGQDQNTLVGGKNYGNSMIARIEFAGEDNVVIFFENGFTIFSNMKKPEEIFEKKFEEPVKSAHHDDKNIMTVTGTPGNEKGQMLYLFDLQGKQEFAESIDYKYSDVQMTEQEIIFTDAQNCRIIRKNGKVKFSFDFEKKVDYFFPAVKDNHYYLLDETSIQLVKISG